MATSNPRALWKGAISFGLVHVPVVLYSAIQDTRPKMRMLDQASGAPVGYQKVAKDTGETVEKSEIVKGMEVDSGQFVTLTKEEIKEALPRSTQTIEIESFVKLDEVPTVFYNKPYFTGPGPRGEKVYALLREVLRRTGRAALGRVVIANKQHLALVVPMGSGLVLNLLRWVDEIRDAGALELPDADTTGLTDKELRMGEQLVLELADDWHPERFRDEFREKLEALVEAKRKAGDILQSPVVETEKQPQSSADVIDLTELLRQSLKKKPAASPEPSAEPSQPASPARTPARKSAARSTGATRKAANDEAAEQRAAAAAKPTGTARSAVKPKATPRASAKSRPG